MKRKSRSKRRRKESVARRIGRQANRILIALTLGVIALYIIPVTTHVAEKSDGTAYSAQPSDITVQVLNGCGEEGLALKATRFLRQHDYDVVEMKNAPHFGYDETEVVAMRESREVAEMVRDALGFGRVVFAPDSTMMLDVSVILGADSRGRIPKVAGRPEQAPEAPGR